MLKNLKFWLLSFLVLPFLGLGPRACDRVRGGCTPEDTGGVAASQIYNFPRAEIGTTYNTGVSASDSYKTNTQLGYFLNEGVTLSDKYKTRHPMSLKVLNQPPSLATP